jgi:outer membrane receptor protein involved in Fe transport
VGGEVRRDRYNQYGNQKATGEFLFDGQATFNPAARGSTGFIFADFIIGETSTAARVAAMANGMLRRSSFYGYIQDDFRVTSKLTLNIGLRYENPRPWHDKYRGIINAQLFDPGVGPDGFLPNSKPPIFTRPGSGDFYAGLNFHFADGQAIQAGDQFMGRSLVNPDNNNWAPRFGLSYSPTSRWTIRTGAGMCRIPEIQPSIWPAIRLDETCSSPTSSAVTPTCRIRGPLPGRPPCVPAGPAPASARRNCSGTFRGCARRTSRSGCSISSVS